MFWLVALAYAVDLAVGDPQFLIHPVVIIGKGISILERGLRAVFRTPQGLKFAGIILTTTIVGASFALTYLALKLLLLISPWLWAIVSVWLISTTVAGKSLKKAAGEIYELLKNRDFAEARKKVGWIVGRDTDKLSESEITRATVETVAENIVDGIISPLFYAFIGGAPLAMAYRAANTLDSMVGYKNERYKDFGWASARFDDLMNFIPARLTAVFILIGTLFMGLPLTRTARVILRDAPRHPSPNSGYPEAAVAGALGVQLGGENYYGGIASFRAHMGDKINNLSADEIIRTNAMVDWCGLAAVITGTAIMILVRYYL